MAIVSSKSLSLESQVDLAVPFVTLVTGAGAAAHGEEAEARFFLRSLCTTGEDAAWARGRVAGEVRLGGCDSSPPSEL